jgi:peptidoglycan/xylan/chitin deacetylase (PgdA/CDA1 family)
MKYLKAHCTVLSMDEIVELKNSNTPYPSNAVAITFDDGFRNNFTVAAPVLNEFNLPADILYNCRNSEYRPDVLGG